MLSGALISYDIQSSLSQSDCYFNQMRSPFSAQKQGRLLGQGSNVFGSASLKKLITNVTQKTLGIANTVASVNCIADFIAGITIWACSNIAKSATKCIGTC